MKIQKRLLCLYFLIACTALSLTAGGNSIQIGTEITYVHTDRNVYIAGEHIFFKLYIIDADSHKLSTISKIAYLVLRNNDQKPVAKLKLKTEGGIAYGNIFLPDSLKSGPYQIIAFTNWMRNAGEGSFFAKEIIVANRFDNDLPALSANIDSENLDISNTTQFPVVNSPLMMITDKTVYNKREKINLTLDFPSNLFFDSINLSISVTEDVPGMNNEFSLARYFNEKFKNSDSGKSAAGESHLYLPEVKGEIVQGKVIDQESHEAVAGFHVFLSATDTLVNLQYSVTGTTGLFRFLLNDYYYDKDIYFSIQDSAGDRKFIIIPEDKFKLTNDFKPTLSGVNLLLKEYILKSQDIVTIQKTYDVVTVAEVKKQAKPNFYCPQLYYKPSYRIYPSDFVSLNDFEEMAKEIIPPQLSLKKQNNRFSARIADENLHQYMDEEPAIFLDGVFLVGIDSLLKLGSDRIKKVDLVCSRFNCGEILFPGILAVFSTKNEIENLKANSSSLRTQFETFHPFSGYSIQSYTQESPAYNPDFRQLLYWNPDLEISPDNNPVTGFYASDHSGNYTIRIEGITSAGVPVSISKRIKIK